MYISGYLLCLGPSYQALSKGTTPLRGDKENRMGLSGCRFQQYYGSTASNRMLRGRSPQGLGGAVYLLVRSFIRVYLFVDIRLSILSIRGRGMLSKTVYLCQIVQVPWIGEQRSSRRTIESQQQWFLRSYHLKKFSPPPLTPTTTTRSCPHAVRRLCVGSGSELRRPGSLPSPRTGAESDFDGPQIILLSTLIVKKVTISTLSGYQSN